MMIRKKNVRNRARPDQRYTNAASAPSEVHSKIHQNSAVPKDGEHALLA